MIKPPKMVEEFEKFTWTVENFSTLKYGEDFSESFLAGGYGWRICLVPNYEECVEGVSICLQVYDYRKLLKPWSITANFKLSLVSQRRSKMTKTIGGRVECNADDTNAWRFVWFMSLDALYDGFVYGDSLTIVAELPFKRPLPENQSDLGARISEYFSTKYDGNNFRDVFGRFEKELVELLVKACLKHPSLIRCHKNRSCRFNKSAFVALGRVLHFLKTKRVKDMNNDAHKELQNLWEELQTFKFDDLNWLKPFVQSALTMMNYMERAKLVKTQNDYVVALEIDLEKERKELVKMKEGFEEIDLDAGLGYGIP